MYKFKLLIVEDDEPKQQSIISFLKEFYDNKFEFILANSLSSAITALSTHKIDFAIIDMSLPTYDMKKDKRGGGSPLGFGGTDVLRFIESESEHTLSVVLTQFEEFKLMNNQDVLDIKGLEATLKLEFEDNFFGVIHYAGRNGDWQIAIQKILDKVF